MREAASLNAAEARSPPPIGYDIFLSHNARDKPAVERLCVRLAREGLEPWFDKWCLTPGGHWQEELAAGLAASRACAVFVGPHDLGAWEREEIGVALSRAAADRSFRLFLVLLPGIPDPFDAANLSPFLSTRTWVDLRDGIERVGGFQALVCAIKGIPFGPARSIETRDDVCPYRGLQTFDEEHAEFFFGRESDVQRLVEKLKASPYLAIVGPSGSGKSSLARAGLVPALRAGALAGSESWAIATLRPGPHPLDTLAAETVALHPDLRAPRVRDDLTADARTLRLLFSRSASIGGESVRFCFLVDQGEEVFTLCRDEHERALFLANLVNASAADGPVSVILTLRADFYARLAAYPELAQQVAHQYLVGPLGASELREAIAEPAHQVGLELESGLVDQILDDVGDEPGTLPLLEHTLFELWQRRRGRMLTLEAYRETGGVEGALAKRADAIYASLEPEAQTVARRILLRLTQPGEGSEDTRRRAAMSELVTRAEEKEAVEDVVHGLADARLLTTAMADETGERSVEVSHEALIRGWPRLRAWLDENRAGLLTHRRLTEAAQEWKRLGRDDSGLYRGARLAEAREWGETNEPVLNELEREFLAASRRLDATERRARTRRMRLTIIGLAIALVLIGIGAGLAFRQSRVAADQRDEAARQRDLAYSGQLAANAVALLPVDPELGLLLAIESAGVAPTAQARDALRQSLRASHLRGVFRGHAGRVWSAAFSPDGTRVVTAGEDGTVRIWETSTRKAVAELRGNSEPVRSASFSPDGQFVVTASEDGTARVWQMASGQVTPLRGHQGAVSDAAFDLDGDLIVTAGADGTARVWDAATGSQLHELEAGQIFLESASFGKGGELVVTAGGDGIARIWDVATEQVVAELPGDGSFLWSAALSRDGQLAATAGEDGTVRIWNVAGADPAHVLRGHTDPVTSVAFSSDDRLVVTASQDLSSRVWDVENEQTVAELLGSRSAVLSAAFSPDDRFVVTAHQDGTARLWEVESERRVATLGGHDNRLKDVSFSPDGTLVAAASDDTTASVRHAGTGTVVAELHGHRDWVESLAFSPDGGRVVTGSFDRTAQIWDAATGESIAVLEGHSDAVTDAAFSPNGELVATASADRTVRLWDVASEDTLRVLRGSRDRVDAVAFSPDGKRIVAASWDGKVRIWSTASGAVTASFTASDRPLRSTSFSPDGKRLLTAGDDSTARVWEVGTWNRLAELRGHTAAVASAAFSPDPRGTFVLTADENGTALVFEVETEALVAELHGPVDSLEAAAFRTDANRVATAGDDGMVRIYTCTVCRSGSDLVELARQRVSRQLTAQERAIYLSSRKA